MRKTVVLSLLLLACSSANPHAASSSPSTADDGGAPGDGDAQDGGPHPIDETCSPGAEDEDRDGDGFTPKQGDCDDCSPQLNPAAYDFPGDEWDEDCSGTAAARGDDDCDGKLAIDSQDARDAARAIGLCKFVSEGERGWGVLEARLTDATGKGAFNNPLQVGLLPDFGVAKPRAGESLLALSTGVARAADQPDYTAWCDLLCNVSEDREKCMAGDPPPPGYPKESSECEAISGMLEPANIFDQAALELKIRVPSNAKSFSFDSAFYSYEYPAYVCSYNDFFVVFQSPKPDKLADENIVFDKNGDPVGVNTALLSVCDKSIQNPAIPKQLECKQGTAFLAGSGFDVGNECSNPDQSGGSTGWLRTTSPVEAGSIVTLRFAIWDTRDMSVDSSVLIDGFTWSVEKPEVATMPVDVL